MDTMSLLMMELDILRLAKRRNADLYIIMCCERDIAERAKQVRERVFKFAFKVLADNRRAS